MGGCALACGGQAYGTEQIQARFLVRLGLRQHNQRGAWPRSGFLNRCGDQFIVVPGDATGPYILTKVVEDAPACGDRMPLGGKLSVAEIGCLRAWVNTLGTGGGNVGTGGRSSGGESGAGGATQVGAVGNDTTGGQSSSCATNISSANQVQPIFTAQCANVGCHTGTRPVGSLSLAVRRVTWSTSCSARTCARVRKCRRRARACRARSSTRFAAGSVKARRTARTRALVALGPMARQSCPR